MATVPCWFITNVAIIIMTNPATRYYNYSYTIIISEISIMVRPITQIIEYLTTMYSFSITSDI